MIRLGENQDLARAGPKLSLDMSSSPYWLARIQLPLAERLIYCRRDSVLSQFDTQTCPENTPELG